MCKNHPTVMGAITALIPTDRFRQYFVVHRMTEWYRERVDPEAKLPYLWTYLAHRGLYSSLVYMTITQELLHRK